MIELVRCPIEYIEGEYLLVCPIATNWKSFNHPIPVVRNMFPIAYSFYRRRLEVDRPLDIGGIILSDHDEKPVCWITVHKAHNTKYKLDYIEESIKEMAALNLHKKYNIAFPALGYYEEDGVDKDDVQSLLELYFSDTDNKVLFVLDY